MIYHRCGNEPGCAWPPERTHGGEPGPTVRRLKSTRLRHPPSEICNDGVDGARTASGSMKSGRQNGCRESNRLKGAPSMGKSITDLSAVTTVGLDLAKHIFQVHGVDASGRVVVTKAMRRNKLLEFFASLLTCVVGLEASGWAHHWARELIKLGHEARIVPPAYAKPYILHPSAEERRSGCGGEAWPHCPSCTLLWPSRSLDFGEHVPRLPFPR